MGFEQGVLQGVGCLLGFSGGAERDGPQPVAVPTDQSGERSGIASDVSREQFGVRSLVFLSHGGSVFTWRGGA